MVEQEGAKTETGERAPIQVQTGDVEVAKLQLAARWAELAAHDGDLEQRLNAFNRAYKSIDETLRM